jgi:hypothetical protein
VSFGIDVEAHAALDALFSGGPDRHLLLSSTEPVFDPAGFTGITEPTAASYARLVVPAVDWPAAADRAVQVDVAWPDCDGTWPAGTELDPAFLTGWWGLTVSTVDATVAWVGRFAQQIPMQSGTSNITLPIRVEAPASLLVNP